MPPSKLMIPLAFGCLTGSKLTLLGTPVNVIAAGQAEEAGLGTSASSNGACWACRCWAGTIVITVLLGRFLLPERRGNSIPADLSAHAYTLIEQYRLDDGLYHLRVRANSPLVGAARSSVTLAERTDLTLIGLLDGKDRAPLKRDTLVEGDILLVRGEAEAIGGFAESTHLAIRTGEDAGPVADALLNRDRAWPKWCCRRARR